jgi:hypothetical protein
MVQRHDKQERETVCPLSVNVGFICASREHSMMIGQNECEEVSCVDRHIETLSHGMRAALEPHSCSLLSLPMEEFYD